MGSSHGNTTQCPGCGVEFTTEDMTGKNTCPVCGTSFDESVRQQVYFDKKIGIITGIVGILLISWMLYRVLGAKRIETTQQKIASVQDQYAAVRKQEKDEAVSKSRVIAFWDKQEHHYALILDLYITNFSEKPLKDPVISCAIKAASGTVFGLKTNTIYQVIGPNTEKRLRINFGTVNSQGEDVDCRCVGASPMD